MRAAFVLQQARQAAKAAPEAASYAANGWTGHQARSYDSKKRRRSPVNFAANEEKERDAKLRQAINLYHLSPTFFPTSAQKILDDAQGQSNSSSSSESASEVADAATSTAAKKGKQNGKASLDDTLDSHIRSVIMGATTPTSSHSNLDSSIEFKLPHQAVAQKIRDDEIAFGTGTADPVMDIKAPTLERLSKEVWPPPTRQRQSTGIQNFSSDPLPLPPIKDKEAVERYIADSIRRKKLAAHNSSSSSSSSSSGTDSADIRGAQVRDALYGTVGIRKPGLEVLRDRIQAREFEEEAKRLAKRRAKQAQEDEIHAFKEEEPSQEEEQVV